MIRVRGSPRRIALGLAVCAVVAAACSGPGSLGGRAPDSLLLVTLDTMRADHVSCYGASPVRTPNLDQLAAKGLRVERAWTPVPLTTPAHATILTGLYPPAHGVRNNARFRLPEDVPTLAEFLRASGRETAAFVGSFTTSRLFGLDRGFATYDDDMGHFPDGRRRSERRGDRVVDRALEWLRGRSGSPFFLWVHLYDPHLPYEPPPPYADRYRENPYAGEVAFTDAQFGRLLGAIQSLGLSRRTVVAAVADHGEGLRTHGEAEHGFLLYEESVWVPFLVAAPGTIEPGTVIREPSSLVDLVPTVLGLLKLAAPPGIQGRDLLAPGREDRGVYAETLYPFEEFGWSALYAYRRQNLKVIQSPRPEMYDLAADPGETRDLFSGRAAESATLTQELDRLKERIVDPARLARAVGLQGGGLGEDDTLARLESLGYIGGGGGVTAGSAEGVPKVGGRNPRDAMEDVHRFDEAQARLFGGDAAGAVPVFEALVASDPRNPQFALKLAQALQRSDQPGAADATFRALVRDHPTFYLGYRSYSEFLERSGRADESRDLWVRLKRLVPGYVGIDARIAQAEIAAGRAADARSRLESYLGARADDAPAWAQLGRAREALGQESNAIDAYRRALAIQPTEADAARGAIRLLLKGRRDDEARALVQSLLAQAPDDGVLTKLAAEIGAASR